MWIQTIANWATGFCEAYFLFIMFDVFLKWRDEIPKYYKIIGIIVVGILIDVSNMFFTTNLINVILIVILDYAASYLYIGSQKMRILSSSISYMLVCVTEVIVLLILSSVFNKTVIDIMNDYRLYGIILSKVLCYASIKTIEFVFRKEKITFDTKYWILFASMFLFTILMVYTFCSMLENGAISSVRNLTMICSIGIGGVTIIVLFFYEQTLHQNYLLAKKQMSEIRLKEQVKHYNDIMMTQGQVKKMKHNLENHLLSIKAQIERSEYTECMNYVNNLLETLDLGDSYVDTGNTVLDAIINAKKTEAERNGIRFNLNIRIPSNLTISQEDECIIFGNALDNAIEACNKLVSDKYINVSLIFNRDSLMCKITNSYNPKEQHVITSKTDVKNHGIGRESINETLKKYDSVSRIEVNDIEYSLFFIIMGL